MHPPILSRYMFNILYNVMIRLINCERFNTNDDEYLKLVVGIERTTVKVSNHSTARVFLQGKAQSSKLPC